MAPARRTKSWAIRAAAAASLVGAASYTSVSFASPGPHQSSSLQQQSLQQQTGYTNGLPAPLGQKGQSRQGLDQDAGSYPRKLAGALAAIAAVCVAFLGPQVELGQVWPVGTAPASARTPGQTTGSGARVNRDCYSLLQLALPLEEILGNDQVKTVRDLQTVIEGLKYSSKLTGSSLAGSVTGSTNDALKLVKDSRKALLKPFAESRKVQAEAKLVEIQAELENVLKGVSLGDVASKPVANPGLIQEESLPLSVASAEASQILLGQFEELMIPPDYSPPIPKDAGTENLPKLIGRATVEFTFKRGPENGKNYAVEAVLYPEAKMTVVCDGWSNPVTAGTFVDLVDKGFYNGMEIQRADGFIIQSGDSGEADEHGYRPAKGEQVRRIPLEVGLKGQKQALYGETIDEARKVGTVSRIPFQADGTISMARKEYDNDSASSQFFLLLFESDMTPAGKNFLDGRYGSFGYTVSGKEFLRKIKLGDIITSVKVLDGIDKLQRPAAALAGAK